MAEIFRIKYKKNPTELPMPLSPMIKEELNRIIKPLTTDQDIKDERDLFSRKINGERPLNVNEEDRLKKLTAKREGEISRIFPHFSFMVIFEIKANRDEAARQFAPASEYFSNIEKLAKTPGAVYHYALYLEKLTNLQHDPKKIEADFPDIFKKRQKKLEKLSEKMENAKHSYLSIDKLESDLVKRKASVEQVTEAINRENLLFKDKFPDYLRLAVLHDPTLVKKAFDEFKNNYIYMNRPKRATLKQFIATHQKNIQRLEELEKKHKQSC